MVNRKQGTIDPHKIKAMYTERLTVYTALSNLRARKNTLSKQIKTSRDPEIMREAQTVKTATKEHEQRLDTIEKELLRVALLVPNDTHPDAPIGPESAARVVKTVGEPRPYTQATEDHMTIAHRLRLVDFEQAALTSGSSFYYLQGYGAFLETALIQYAMEKAAERGYLAVCTPDIVRTSIAHGCGFQPRSNESSQTYHVNTSAPQVEQDATLCLAGTAEIPLAGKFANVLLDEASLPRRLVGFGHAFRAEAGGRGTETKGLYRVHQFSKVELFAVSTPEQSGDILDEFLEIQEEMYKELGLCFRVLDMPTEELGASAYRKYDMEAWLPGRQQWGEISSTSNCTDYQSRRLSIRYRPTHPQGKQMPFCHTINGTAIAVPRIIIAILETFQQENKSVKVPEVLRKWLPGQPEFLK
ncbi:seryl-tRNA synthetase [Syncephalastrum racemosum]|uniref:serine--tRNA ligase n=1 Tax=Syncephalastrum racemosum TaxID=13706 RepID=A0A1X2H101_SYNRA|nr:seryl-tRNA synthetase [Syncephalastrum racemosum]